MLLGGRETQPTRLRLGFPFKALFGVQGLGLLGERERERDAYTYRYTYIHIYIYVHRGQREYRDVLQHEGLGLAGLGCRV